jgi:hypothetical protein
VDFEVKTHLEYISVVHQLAISAPATLNMKAGVTHHLSCPGWQKSVPSASVSWYRNNTLPKPAARVPVEMSHRVAVVNGLFEFFPYLY